MEGVVMACEGSEGQVTGLKSALVKERLAAREARKRVKELERELARKREEEG